MGIDKGQGAAYDSSVGRVAPRESRNPKGSRLFSFPPHSKEVICI